MLEPFQKGCNIGQKLITYYYQQNIFWIFSSVREGSHLKNVTKSGKSPKGGEGSHPKIKKSKIKKFKIRNF